MKKYIKSTLLMLLGAMMLTACSDDNGSNPVLNGADTFVLNTPAIANQPVDLANSTSIVLTCSQPNYGFPAATVYQVEVATDANMSDATLLSTKSTSAKIELDAAEVASTLTSLYVAKGKAEEDFPFEAQAYFRAVATMQATTGDDIANTTIKSNVVSLNKVELEFSLPPVTGPENLYIVGSFNGWNWDKALTMVPVYGTDNVFWHMVYIDESGIKFNTALAWDGGECGYNEITVDPAGELAGEIVENGGNIASSKPGWYLMIVTAEVEGRDIIYTVTFNQPIVRFIGVMVGGWDEGMGDPFTVPATADGDFVSPETIALAGNDSDGCVRMYVKVPSYDWWKSEFIVGLDGDNISYRGTGDDQDRVGCKAGQHVYLNFGTDTGSIK